MMKIFKHASLCSGIGAAELAASWMGWKNEFSVEIDDFCNKVLKYHYPKAIHVAAKKIFKLIILFLYQKEAKPL